MIDGPARRPIHWALLTSLAVLVCLFLFYIDEGRCTLDGLFCAGNLVAMSFYLIGLLIGLFGMNALFEKRPPSLERTAAVLGLGTLAGIALTIAFLWLIRGGSLPQ